MSVNLVLTVVALALGLVAVVGSNGKSWPGWGVIALAVSQLI